MKKTVAMLLVALLIVTGMAGFVQPAFASSQMLEVTTDALNYRSSPWGTIHGVIYRGENICSRFTEGQFIGYLV